MPSFYRRRKAQSIHPSLEQEDDVQTTDDTVRVSNLSPEARHRVSFFHRGVLGLLGAAVPVRISHERFFWHSLLSVPAFCFLLRRTFDSRLFASLVSQRSFALSLSRHLPVSCTSCTLHPFVLYFFTMEQFYCCEIFCCEIFYSENEQPNDGPNLVRRPVQYTEGMFGRLLPCPTFQEIISHFLYQH